MSHSGGPCPKTNHIQTHSPSFSRVCVKDSKCLTIVHARLVFFFSFLLKKYFVKYSKLRWSCPDHWTLYSLHPLEDLIFASSIMSMSCKLAVTPIRTFSNIQNYDGAGTHGHPQCPDHWTTMHALEDLIRFIHNLHLHSCLGNWR